MPNAATCWAPGGLWQAVVSLPGGILRVNQAYVRVRQAEVDGLAAGATEELNMITCEPTGGPRDEAARINSLWFCLHHLIGETTSNGGPHARRGTTRPQSQCPVRILGK